MATRNTVLALGSAALLAFSLTACSGSDEKPVDTKPTAEVTEEAQPTDEPTEEATEDAGASGDSVTIAISGASVVDDKLGLNYEVLELVRYVPTEEDIASKLDDGDEVLLVKVKAEVNGDFSVGADCGSIKPLPADYAESYEVQSRSNWEDALADAGYPTLERTRNGDGPSEGYCVYYGQDTADTPDDGFVLQYHRNAYEVIGGGDPIDEIDIDVPLTPAA